MQDLLLYTISDVYVQFLRSTCAVRVFANKANNYVHTRKYLGVVLSLGNYNYYAPLSSPKKTDYCPDGSIRKSIIPIIRMVDSKQDGTKDLMGTIKFSNMIPVPDSQLQLYDIESEIDQHYKDLVNKEIRFINRHTAEVVRNASVLYKQKCNNMQIGYLENTVDFKALELAHDQFIIENS